MYQGYNHYLSFFANPRLGHSTMHANKANHVYYRVYSLSRSTYDVVSV